MAHNEFVRNLAAGTYDLVVLAVLDDGPDCGSGILRRIAERSTGTIRWHQGTLYPVLHRLETRSLLTSDWRGPKQGRRRRYYRLTERGRHLGRAERDQWRVFRHGVDSLLASRAARRQSGPAGKH